MTIYFKNKLNNLVILYMFASKNKFTRVNQIERNKFGSYYHQNSAKFLNKVFETDEIIPKEPTIIQESPKVEEIFETIDLTQEPEQLLVLNKIDTEEPIIEIIEPILENTEKRIIMIGEPIIIEKPNIIEDDIENNIELTDLYDETPEESQTVIFIDENFRENSFKKKVFLTSNFIKCKSWN